MDGAPTILQCTLVFSAGALVAVALYARHSITTAYRKARQAILARKAAEALPDSEQSETQQTEGVSGSTEGTSDVGEDASDAGPRLRSRRKRLSGEEKPEE